MRSSKGSILTSALTVILTQSLLSAGVPNCPQCTSVISSERTPETYFYFEYTPSRLECRGPNTSSFECLTSPLYQEYTYVRTCTWDSYEGKWYYGPWVLRSYSPCYTDDTECWRT
jgi:hypothetical protein